MPAQAKSREHYESTWDRVRSIVESEKAKSKSRAEILRAILQNLSGRFLSNQRFLDYYTQVGVEFDAQNQPTQRIEVRDGAYEVVPFNEFDNNWAANTLVSFLAANANEFDCVVELGSGFGRNLFVLDDQLRDFGQQLPLHACELTEKGREVTQSLWKMDQSTSLSVHPFDFYKPDLSFLERGSRVLFFTGNSIEQIPVLPKCVFDEMLSRTTSCCCFHFEPVGWQANPELVNRRRRIDASGPGLHLAGRFVARSRDFLNRFSKSNRFRAKGYDGIRIERDDIGSSKRVAENAFAWSALAGYNTNLLGLLDELQQEKRISITGKTLNAFGSNPFNPDSVIHWESKQ